MCSKQLAHSALRKAVVKKSQSPHHRIPLKNPDKDFPPSSKILNVLWRQSFLSWLESRTSPFFPGEATLFWEKDLLWITFLISVTTSNSPKIGWYIISLWYVEIYRESSHLFIHILDSVVHGIGIRSNSCLRFFISGGGFLLSVRRQHANISERSGTSQRYSVR